MKIIQTSSVNLEFLPVLSKAEFLAALGLCCSQFSALVQWVGVTLHCNVWACHCVWAYLVVESVGSRAPGLSSCGNIDQLHAPCIVRHILNQRAAGKFPLWYFWALDGFHFSNDSPRSAPLAHAAEWQASLGGPRRLELNSSSGLESLVWLTGFKGALQIMNYLPDWLLFLAESNGGHIPGQNLWQWSLWDL